MKGLVVALMTLSWFLLCWFPAREPWRRALFFMEIQRRTTIAFLKAIKENWRADEAICFAISRRRGIDSAAWRLSGFESGFTRLLCAGGKRHYSRWCWHASVDLTDILEMNNNIYIEVCLTAKKQRMWMFWNHTSLSMTADMFSVLEPHASLILKANFHNEWKLEVAVTVKGKILTSPKTSICCYVYTLLLMSSVKFLLIVLVGLKGYSGPLRMDVKLARSVETPTLPHKPEHSW